MNPREGGHFPESRYIPPQDPIEPVDTGGSNFFLEKYGHSPREKTPLPLSPPTDNTPPPTDNKVIGPTEKDKYLANNGIPTIETRIGDFLGQHSGAVSMPVAFGLFGGGGIIIGGAAVFLATEVFASDKPFEESIDSVPGGTSFSNDDSTPQLIKGSPPHPEQQPQPINKGNNPKGMSQDNTDSQPPSSQIEIKKKVKPEKPNGIKLYGFREPPPNRTRDESMSSEDASKDKLPNINDYITKSTFGDRVIETNFNINTGVDFRLQERPPEEVEIKQTFHYGTPTGPEERTQYRYPYARIAGYLIGKEIHPDGSVMLAVEIPGENGLFNQTDIDKSTLSMAYLRENGNQGRLKGAVVWLKLTDFIDFNLPPLHIGYGWDDTPGSMSLGRTSNDPNELYNYIKVGDPLYASSHIGLSSLDEERLEKNYHGKNNLTYDQARKNFLTTANSNASVIKRMLVDVEAGNVSLGEQLGGKKYVLKIHELAFVPRNQ